MARLAIIGAGASGLFSACLLSDYDIKIDLYEKNQVLGKKLQQTGNGRGNISNYNMSSDFYNFNIDDLLKEFSPLKFIEILKKFNIYTKSDSEGRIYPITSAKDFTEILVNIVKKRCNIINEEVIKIENKTIYTNDSRKEYDYIIYAIGSSSSLKFETKNLLNLKMTKLKPGLVPIKVDSSLIRGLNGIRVASKVSLYLDNNLIKEEQGELQFKEDALSGILIFQLSSYISRLNYKTKHVIIDFLPQFNKDELIKIILDVKKNKLFHTITDNLRSLINPKLLLRLLENKRIKNIINDVNIISLVDIIKGYKIDLLDNYPIQNSQVTVGGIQLSEINLKTFESKIKGLYILGEALDIDGLCGGYNLHFAFLSSYIACRSIGEKLC